MNFQFSNFPNIYNENEQSIEKSTKCYKWIYILNMNNFQFECSRKENCFTAHSINNIHWENFHISGIWWLLYINNNLINHTIKYNFIQIVAL